MSVWPDTGTSEGRLASSVLQAALDAASAAEDAAALYSDSSITALAAADPYAIPFRSGDQYTLFGHGGLTTTTPSNSTLTVLPFRPAKSCTMSKIAVNQTVAGEAGSIIRLVILDDLDGRPNTVLYQGTLAGDGANGEKSLDPDLAIVPTTMYWAGVAMQSATTTRPTISAFQALGLGNRGPTTTITTAARSIMFNNTSASGVIASPTTPAHWAGGGVPCPAIWVAAD